MFFRHALTVSFRPYAWQCDAPCAVSMPPLGVPLAFSFSSAVPLSQRLVDPTIGITRRLFTGQLLLHAQHPGAEGLATSCSLGTALRLLS